MECLWYTFCIHSHTCPSECPSLSLGDILPELCSNNHWLPSEHLQYLVCLNSVIMCIRVHVQDEVSVTMCTCVVTQERQYLNV